MILMNDKFIMAPIEIITDPRLTFMQTKVLMALLSFRGKNTNLVWPKRKTLCDLLGYTESNISKVTKQLVDLGWLEKEGNGGRSMSAKYLIIVPSFQETVSNLDMVAKQETVSNLDRVAKQETVSNLDRVYKQETVSNLETVAKLETVASLDRCIKETNEQTRRERVIRAHEKSFENFWAVYPKKKSRDKALTAWLKINPDEQLQQTIIAAVVLATTQDFDWLKDNGQFVPYASTYLNGKRWEDEITQKIQNTPAKASSSDYQQHGNFNNKTAKTISAGLEWLNEA